MSEGASSKENGTAKRELLPDESHPRYQAFRRRRRAEKIMLLAGILLAAGMAVVLLTQNRGARPQTCCATPDWIGKNSATVLSVLGKPDATLGVCVIRLGPVEQAVGKALCYSDEGIIIGTSEDGQTVSFVACVDGSAIFADAAASVVDESSDQSANFKTYKNGENLPVNLGASREEIIKAKGLPFLSIIVAEDNRLALVCCGAAAGETVIYLNANPSADMPEKIERNGLIRNAAPAPDEKESRYEIMIYPNLVLALLRGRLALIHFCPNGLEAGELPDLIERRRRPICDEPWLRDGCGIVFEKCALLVRDGRITMRHTPPEGAAGLLAQMNWKNLATYEAEKAYGSRSRKPRIYIIE